MNGVPLYHSDKKLQRIGSYGEHIAAHFLEEKGYKILDQNVFSRWGELDIVAQKRNKIYFIEVKTRVHLKQGMPYEAVRIPKLAHLMRAIQHYIIKNHLHHFKFQLDVISIILEGKDPLDIRHYENVEVDRFY